MIRQLINRCCLFFWPSALNHFGCGVLLVCAFAWQDCRHFQTRCPEKSAWVACSFSPIFPRKSTCETTRRSANCLYRVPFSCYPPRSSYLFEKFLSGMARVAGSVDGGTGDSRRSDLRDFFGPINGTTPFLFDSLHPASGSFGRAGGFQRGANCLPGAELLDHQRSRWPWRIIACRTNSITC